MLCFILTTIVAYLLTSTLYLFLQDHYEGTEYDLTKGLAAGYNAFLLKQFFCVCVRLVDVFTTNLCCSFLVV